MIMNELRIRSLVLEEIRGLQPARRELVFEYHGPNGPELITEGCNVSTRRSLSLSQT